MKNSSLLLNANDLRELVRHVGLDALMDQMIDRLAGAVRGYDRGNSQLPIRQGFNYSEPEWGLLEWMPAYFRGDGTTVKLVGYHPGNPELRGIPSVLSTICVFDTVSGHLRGIVDGTFLTAARTGAASAVASRVLADPKSKSVGIVGCGAQAVTQIHALSRVFDLDKVFAYDTDGEAARSLQNRIERTRLEVEVVERSSLAGTLELCDIICTCTSSAPGQGPVVPEFDHQPHLHINAVGSDFPDKIELPAPMLRKALVVPDFLDQAVMEGECQQLESSEIGPDLRTMLSDENRYREKRDSLTVFDSTGWSLEDHVAAKIALEYAEEFGLGREAEFECLASDPKDPYSFLDDDAPTGRLSRQEQAEFANGPQPR